MHLPLQGVTVVACEQAVAAPLATRQLADLGARVIKIERPDGGDFARGYDETVHGQSSHFVWLNRAKESLVLDLKRDRAIAVVDQLLAKADVFVQNFAPGAAERLGLGSARLCDRYPSLICCSISGYGPTGPMRDAKAYDLLIQAEAGLVSITGTEDAPAKAGIPAADIAGGMYAFASILTALYHRERTGEGADISINLFDSLLEWMGYPLYYTRYGGSAPQRAGTSHAAIAPYGSFTTGDQTTVVLSVQSEREWLAFCTSVLRRPELAGDPRFASQALRVSNRIALDAEIDAVLVGLTGAEFVARLSSAGIAQARQRSLPDVIDHPQLTQRQRWVDVATPGGPVAALLPPIAAVGLQPRMGPVPALGEHTDAILRELGLADRDQEEAGVT